MSETIMEKEEIVAGGASKSLRHESGRLHVAGKATYIDDIPVPDDAVHVVPGLSTRAHARIVSIDLEPVKSFPGVVHVLTAADVRGENQISPVHAGDEPLFAEDEVFYYGQPIFAVVAETRQAARKAARLAEIVYEDLPAFLSIEEARKAGGRTVWRPLEMKRGDAEQALKDSPKRASGRLVVGGQEQFYLEGQAALAKPGEEGEMHVWSSTQHPTETQHLVAHILDRPSNLVTVEIRRLGGGFGGKETQATPAACMAALAADITGRFARCRLDRDDDMIMTGKRHDFVIDYDVGFDADGVVHGVDMVLAARCGWSADLSGPVTDRALFHADNAYYYPDVRFRSEPLLTHTQSNTAFRGFGGPQGIAAAERVMEEIAHATGLDPLDVRLRNVYGREERNLTPYYMTVEDSISYEIMTQLAKECAYRARREEIRAFNRKRPYIRRGSALPPV
ncbi:molybdopterin cofactor-binding domain-containing protein, partial [Acetobacter sp.]|uniref:molybdopterin cofactor-binding domain-containing protein n=1 Tax=Acetobacter sp. TaxID=440 RepID=UPI0039EC3F6A